MFYSLPDNRIVTLCIVTVTNESDTQIGGFSLVVTVRIETLLCINRVPTETSCDSCRAQDCNKLNTVS